MIEVTQRELVISLPHGLRGHVAYVDASDWLAEQSKKAAAAAAAAALASPPEEDAGSGSGKKKKRKSSGGPAAAAAAGEAPALPPLSQLFSIGQLVRCTVTALRDGQGGGSGKQGTKESAAGTGGAGDAPAKKQRKRVELTLRVSKMNAGLGGWAGGQAGRRAAGCERAVHAVWGLRHWRQGKAEDARRCLARRAPFPPHTPFRPCFTPPPRPAGLESLKEGLALPACVRSVEDHGYLLTLGIKGATGFLLRADAEAAGRQLAPGSLVEVVVMQAPPGSATVTVGCGQEAVAGAVAREWDGLNIGERSVSGVFFC